MKTPSPSLRLIAASFAVASLLCLPLPGRAVSVTMSLNSSQSYLDASGNAFGLNFGPQAPGAMRSYFGGYIVADYTAGVFTFSGGSAITGINNPAGPFSSVPYPGGPWPGNYG